jgi:signal peptidase II
LIWFDQFTKKLAVVNLKGQSDHIIWENVFRLHYLENHGAAFGMLQDQIVFFIVIAAVILFFVGYALIRLPAEKHFYAIQFLLVAIASGAVGNMIDRVSNRYVVDFFYFSLINFPVFNVADIYVTVGTFVLIFFILFVYKEEDLQLLMPTKDR